MSADKYDAGLAAEDALRRYMEAHGWTHVRDRTDIGFHSYEIARGEERVLVRVPVYEALAAKSPGKLIAVRIAMGLQAYDQKRPIE